MPLIVRPFRAADQQATRTMIVQGLGEHFGFINETINADLDDIASSYAGDRFLVAEEDGEIVGSGALVYEGGGRARIMRMSVRKERRRQGVASTVLNELLAEAQSLGCRRVVLETGDWPDAVGFYFAHGFVVISSDASGHNMAIDL